jgi:DNA modification methylase
MNTWINENDFYDTFLVPLIAKCIRGCKAGGKVCFNISPEMYDKLVPRFRPCDNEIDLLQSKRLGKDKQDKIYIWNC